MLHYLKQAFPFPLTVSVKESKATVALPQELPKEIAAELSRKLKELTGADVEFKKEKKEEKEIKAAEKPTTPE